MGWLKASLATRWRGEAQRTVGLDLTAQSLKLVVLEPASNHSNRCVHATKLPLPPGAVNGLVLDGFDLIADTLAAQVQDLGLEGHAVAMALPAQGVREVSWSTTDGPFELCNEAMVFQHVQQTIQLPLGPWRIDFGVEHTSNEQQAWAVVARESVVQERFELAEQGGLVPTVLDVDRLALDRLLNQSRQKVEAGPGVWMMCREGVVSVHLAASNNEVASASAYAMPGNSLESEFRNLLFKLMSGSNADQWRHQAVSISLVGVDDCRSGLMEAVQSHWPQAFEVESPCAVWMEHVDSPNAYAVALGLALHPGLV